MLSLKATNESLQLQTGTSAPTFQFPSDVTSSVGPAVTETSLNIGFVFRVLTNVTATGIRYYSSASGISVTPSLYDDVSGALIATGPSHTTTTVGWEFIPFSTVFYLVPAVSYVVNVWVPSGQYNSVTVGGFPFGDGIVYNSSVYSGRYQYNGVLVKPTSSSAIRYGVDIVVQQTIVNQFPSDSNSNAGITYNDSAPLNVGFLFAVTNNTVAIGIRYNASASGVDVTPTLYDDSSGAVLATGASYTTTAVGWVTLLFYANYTLVPGVDYVASIWSSTGRYYAAAPGGFPYSDGLVYNTISNSGRYLYSAAAKPTNTTSARYGVDIVVQQINQSPTPTIKGYTYLNHNISSPVITITPDTTIRTGDWMIMVMETYTGSGAGTITDPPGWTVIQPATSTGTLVTAIYAKNRIAGETSYTLAITSAGNVSTLTLLWGSGAAPISSWIIGANMLRPNITPTTLTNNVAPSITTKSANNLVLSLSTERTTTNESSIISMSGASQWFYGTQYDASSIQTLSVGYIKQTKPGATSDVTIVYSTAQANNGMARQIAIPPANYNLDYSVSYIDTAAGSAQPSSNEGKITSAGTATVLPAPSASTTRLIKTMSITNTDPYISTLVVVQKNIGGSLYQQSSSFTLLAGETAQYMDKKGWKYYAANGAIKADQTTLQSNNTAVQFNSSGTLNHTSGPSWTTSNTGLLPVAISGSNNAPVQQSNASSLGWYGFTASSDGTKVAGVISGGYIFTSIDSGYNWTQQTSSGSRNWRAIAGSVDGKNLVAAVNNGYIYTSSDYGVTWVQQTGSSSQYWVAVASSADGTKLAAVVFNGYIYTSSDSGVTWATLTGAGFRNWNSIASSVDGTRLVAAVYGGTMYTSVDSGENWVAQAGSGSRNWYSVVSSNDGTKLAASVQSDYIYTSSDSGVTWTAQVNSGSKNWYNMATSSDGRTLAAAGNGDYISLSTDSGATWSQLNDTTTRNWVGLSLSADGSKLVGGVSVGYAYTYTLPPRTTKALTLSSTDSILALKTHSSDPSQNSSSYVLTPATPTIIGNSSYNAGGYSGGITPSVTTPSNAQVGDLTIIISYVEPNNEGKPAATYGTFTLPTGVTLAPGFPIETDPATLTSSNDHRMYVWYYYATAAGATTLTFTNDYQIYWGLASVTVRGGPTSGNPFADTPSMATSGTTASGITSTPPVSLTLGGPNSLVLWAYTDWDGINPGYPSGFADISHASNYPGQPALGFKTYAYAGATGTISATRSGNDQGMGAALLSLRGRTPSTPYVASTGTPVNNLSSSTLAVPVPSGVAIGDLIVLALGAEWNSTTLPDASSLSVPGFTVAQVAAYQSYTNYAETNFLLYKYATAADTGTYTVTYSTVSGGSVDLAAGVASIIRNGPVSGNPFTDTFQYSHAVGSPTVSISSFTPTANNSLLLGSTWWNDTTSSSTTYPSGWAVQANIPSSTAIMLSTLQQSTSAATGTLSWGSSTGTPDPVVLIGTIRVASLSAPTVASTGTVSAVGTTSVSPGVPSGVTIGSLIVAFITVDFNASPTISTAITPPTGFLLGGSTVYDETVYNTWVALVWYYKYANSADSGTYTFTINSSAADASAYAQRIVGGPSSGNPFVDSFQSASSATNVSSVTIPSFTPAGDNSLLIAGIFTDNNAGGLLGVPSGWTMSDQANQTTDGTLIGVGNSRQSNATATGSLVFTTAGSSPMGVLVATIRSLNSSQSVSIANNSLALYGRTTSGHATMSVIDAVLSPMAVQAALWQNNTMTWTPSGNVGTWQGTSGVTVGTATSVLPTTTNVYTAMRRSTFSSVVTTTNQQVGIRSDLMFFMGTTLGQGGFFFSCRFGFDSIATGMRAFIGLCPSTSIVNTDPSNSLNTLGFAFDLADTAFSFYHNNGSGTAVKEPISGQGTLATNNTGYDAYIWSPPNSANVYYRLDRTDTGATIVDSFVSSILPVAGTMLMATAQMSNGTANTSANAAVLGINRLYVETNR